MFKSHFDSNPYREIGLIISLLTDVRRISYAGYSTKKKKKKIGPQTKISGFPENYNAPLPIEIKKKKHKKLLRFYLQYMTLSTIDINNLIHGVSMQ